MKIGKKMMVLGLLLSLLMLFTLVGSAMSLCGFRYLDETSSSNANVDFFYRHSYDEKSGNVNLGQLSFAYSRRFNSPMFGFDMSTNDNVSISGLELLSFFGTGEANIKYYFTPNSSWFAFAGTKGKISSSYSNILGLEIRGGFGFGRFNDVTPLAKAMKINAYLLGEGIIAGNLTNATIKNIAYKIANLAYDTMPELMDVLQYVIEQSPLLQNKKLDAHVLFKIGEIVDNRTYTRLCGGEIKLGLGYELLDIDGDPNDLLAIADANFGFAFDPWTQFLCRASFSTGPTPFTQNYQMELMLGGEYLITETIAFSSSYSFLRETRDSIPADIHNLDFNVAWTPVQSVKGNLAVLFKYEPGIGWSRDIRVSFGMALL